MPLRVPTASERRSRSHRASSASPTFPLVLQPLYASLLPLSEYKWAHLAPPPPLCTSMGPRHPRWRLCPLVDRVACAKPGVFASLTCRHCHDIVLLEVLGSRLDKVGTSCTGLPLPPASLPQRSRSVQLQRPGSFWRCRGRGCCHRRHLRVWSRVHCRRQHLVQGAPNWYHCSHGGNPGQRVVVCSDSANRHDVCHSQRAVQCSSNDARWATQGPAESDLQRAASRCAMAYVHVFKLSCAFVLKGTATSFCVVCHVHRWAGSL
jgi:hypothetical protein